VSYRADKDLGRAERGTLFGRDLPPCLPAGRFPGLDAEGRGTWDILSAVVQPCGTLWDPYRGFEPR
jgi:hypothetical protein